MAGVESAEEVEFVWVPEDEASALFDLLDEDEVSDSVRTPRPGEAKRWLAVVDVEGPPMSDPLDERRSRARLSVRPPGPPGPPLLR